MIDKLPVDGFHWEEWRDGVLVRSGWHDADTLDGKWNRAEIRVDQALTLKALDELYGDTDKP